jgi:hypothetical protein
MAWRGVTEAYRYHDRRVRISIGDRTILVRDARRGNRPDLAIWSIDGKWSSLPMMVFNTMESGAASSKHH